MITTAFHIRAIFVKMGKWRLLLFIVQLKWRKREIKRINKVQRQALTKRYSPCCNRATSPLNATCSAKFREKERLDNDIFQQYQATSKTARCCSNIFVNKSVICTSVMIFCVGITHVSVITSVGKKDTAIDEMDMPDGRQHPVEYMDLV